MHAIMTAVVLWFAMEKVRFFKIWLDRLVCVVYILETRKVIASQLTLRVFFINTRNLMLMEKNKHAESVDWPGKIYLTL